MSAKELWLRRVLIASLLSAIFWLPAPAISSQQAANEAFTYYGYVPPRIWEYELIVGTEPWEYRPNPASVLDRALLVLVGNHDETKAQVYTLPKGTFLREFTLNRFEKAMVQLPNGTFFKVAANRPVMVLLMAGVNVEGGNSFITSFLTSTKGGYVGKEFIFVALQARTPMYAMGLPFKLYALEDSGVKVWDANGTEVASFEVKANGFWELSFTPLGVYRLASTGNVMVQSFAGGTTFYPSARGGFLGTVFYGTAFPSDWEDAAGYQQHTHRLTAAEDSRTKIIDLANKRVFLEGNVAAGSNLTFRNGPPNLAVESDRPVVFMFRGPYPSGGLAYMGLAANQTAYVYIPTDEPPPSIIGHPMHGGGSTGEAYLFTAKEAVVALDDVLMRVPEDGIISLPPGLHRLSATQNIVVEVIHWWTLPSSAGLTDFAACIPPVESMSLSETELRLKPILAEEFPWMYVIPIVLLVIVVAAWFLRKRAKTTT